MNPGNFRKLCLFGAGFSFVVAMMDYALGYYGFAFVQLIFAGIDLALCPPAPTPIPVKVKNEEKS